MNPGFGGQSGETAWRGVLEEFAKRIDGYLAASVRDGSGRTIRNIGISCAGLSENIGDYAALAVANM